MCLLIALSTPAPETSPVLRESVWVDHDTDVCPVSRSVWVDVMRYDGSVDYAFPAFGWNWSRIGLYGPINTCISAWRVSAYQPGETTH